MSLLRRRARRAVIPGAEICELVDETSTDAETGAVTSRQAADIVLPAKALEGLWDPEHLERVARTYWTTLQRFTLGFRRGRLRSRRIRSGRAARRRLRSRGCRGCCRFFRGHRCSQCLGRDRLRLGQSDVGLWNRKRLGRSRLGCNDRGRGRGRLHRRGRLRFEQRLSPKRASRQRYSQQNR